MSKLSFQYGLSVFLMTPVVFVCSPLMVATAKGSGNPAGQRQLTLRSTSGQQRGYSRKTSLLYRPSAAMTTDNGKHYSREETASEHALVTRRLGCAGRSAMVFRALQSLGDGRRGVLVSTRRQSPCTSRCGKQYRTLGLDTEHRLPVCACTCLDRGKWYGRGWVRIRMRLPPSGCAPPRVLEVGSW